MVEPAHGPLCECDRVTCMRELPVEAWKVIAPRTTAGGDRPIIVAPGHKSPGDRIVERRSGYHILEETPA